LHPAEEHIRQAIERGEFDHLSGKGKPLRWEEYPFEDPDRRLAHHILRNAGFTLPWIEARQGLLTEIAQARSVWQACEQKKMSYVTLAGRASKESARRELWLDQKQNDEHAARTALYKRNPS
jgi:hypothetical protein